MNEDILDAIEKNTGPRTCPKCGYEFPYKEFIRRYVMSIGLSKWACQGCHTLIKCDFIRIQIIWLVGIALSGISFGFLTAYFDYGIIQFISIFPSLLIVLYSLFYVEFEKCE